MQFHWFDLFDFFLNFSDGLVSYSIPKGVQRGLEIDLSDQTYDGHDESDRLVGGLGQLVDGQRGTDNFRTDIHGFGKGMSTSDDEPNSFKLNKLVLPSNPLRTKLPDDFSRQ